MMGRVTPKTNRQLAERLRSLWHRLRAKHTVTSTNLRVTPAHSEVISRDYGISARRSHVRPTPWFGLRLRDDSASPRLTIPFGTEPNPYSRLLSDSTMVDAPETKGQERPSGIEFEAEPEAKGRAS